MSEDITGLMDHLKRAFDMMEQDLFCRVHGQALEKVISILESLDTEKTDSQPVNKGK